MKFKLPLIPQDKANHFIYGIIIYFIINLVFGIIAGVSVGVVAAIGKEIYDGRHINHTADWKDAAYTIAGVLLGALLTIL
jgi:hypothetical protein